jgi:hypothetical protein
MAYLEHCALHTPFAYTRLYILSVTCNTKKQIGRELTIEAESVHFEGAFDLTEVPQGLAVTAGAPVIDTKWLP